MALFVHITDECRRNAKAHNLLRELEEFARGVERTQSTSRFDPFPAPYLVKKKLGGRQGRLIAQYRQLEEHGVIICLAVMIRADRAYSEFSLDAVGYGERYFRNVPSNTELSGEIGERLREAVAAPKPDPTDEECNFLYGAFARSLGRFAEDMVCETREWVEQVTQERVANQLAILLGPCLNALRKEAGLHFLPAAKAGWGVWVLRLPERLLLISVESDPGAKRELAERVALRLGGERATDDAVLRESRRAYPALLLADDDLWIQTQKETVAWMALSPEESEVLDKARRSDHPFPLFINGRAGSGKSTILQYLFADLLFFYVARPEARTAMEAPIYLTANADLLARARTFVERLMKAEVALGESLAEGIAPAILDEAFQEFHLHMLSLLSQDGRNLFPRSKRIDYARFRQMWTSKFGKTPAAQREFGPDLSWHVIRSYIKGMNSEVWMDPDDYLGLPENQITVTESAFRAVHDRVWIGWYQCLAEDGYWDDQDLARYVLENELVKPLRPAVVCDEAQDFTRVELEILLRLNLFSNRTLTRSNVHRVPFAFAGDPFQTLNPTGFRWEAIKATFVEKFIFALDPAQRSGIVDLNYKELQFNYRSTESIVRFGNSVQALRGALLDPQGLQPQVPWSLERNPFPVSWFRIDDGNFWNKFQENPEFVVIVPCDEGEERAFVESDPVLKEHIQIRDGVPVNVLSAVRAKGCEYPAVVVYGFGAKAPRDLMADIESCEETLFDANQRLPIEYFINRLYVSISRPKQRLVVVDSDEGLHRLWEFARNQEKESAMLDRLGSARYIWEDKIEAMMAGNPDDLTRRSAADRLQTARTFEEDGRSRQDSYLLLQAAQAWRNLGNSAKSLECQARAREADREYIAAGDAYCDVGLPGDAVRCYWRAGREGWARLVAAVGDDPALMGKPECVLAQAVERVPKPLAAAEMFGRIAMILVSDPVFLENCLGDSIWSDAVSTLGQAVLDTHAAGVEPSAWAPIAQALDQIRACGVFISPAVRAQLWFRAGQYDRAIRAWDETQAEKPREYSMARAAVEPYPVNLEAMKRCGALFEISEAWRGAPDLPLTPAQTEIVAEALLGAGSVQDAAELAWRSGSAKLMLSVVPEALAGPDKQLAKGALQAGIILLAQRQQWDSFSGLRRSGFIPTVEAWRGNREVQRFVQAQEAAVRAAFVRGFARSSGFDGAPVKDICEFLREFLRVREDDSKNSWQRSVSFEEAGAALEMGRRYVDAVAFYNAVRLDPRYKSIRDWATDRWLLCRRRHAEHEKALGKPQIDHDLREDLKKLGIDAQRLDRLPAVPVLRPLELSDFWQRSEPAGSKPAPIAPEENVRRELGVTSAPAVVIDKLRFEFSRQARRCNITNIATFATASIKLTPPECGGDVPFRRQSDEYWECAEWGIGVRFAGGAVLAELLDGSISIRFQYDEARREAASTS